MSDIATGLDIIDRLNAERNARIADSTKMQCKICWYVYDPQEGCPETKRLRAPLSRICPHGGLARIAATANTSSSRFLMSTTPRSDSYDA